MGTHCSSEINRGHISKSKTAIMKLLLLTVFVASAYATEEVADAAKPVAVAPVHAVHPYVYGHHPIFYGFLGHQQQWPSISGPGGSSTCFGCRGKRSAEADAEAEPGYGFYGYYPYGYYGLHRGYYGLPFGAGVAGHPGAATSYSHRSVQGIGKRSAEEEAAPAEAEAAPVAAVAPVHYGLPFFGYGLPAIYNNPTLQWPGVKTPFFERTTWGLRGKRSAEADAEPGYCGYPYGYYGYPYYGYRTGNYVHRSPQGLGK